MVKALDCNTPFCDVNVTVSVGSVRHSPRCTHKRTDCNPIPDGATRCTQPVTLCISGAARCDCRPRKLPSGKRRRLHQRAGGARVGPQGEAIGYRL
eukprot:scaffold48970_cov66-Phaeocystis_antarctica.AAC.1